MGSFELAEQTNLWQWKFSLGVSQIHESAGPRAQAAPSLVQGEVSILLVLHRVCMGTARAGLALSTGDTEVSKEGNRRGGYLFSCHAPWGQWLWQKGFAGVMTLVSKTASALEGESPRSVLICHG